MRLPRFVPEWHCEKRIPRRKGRLQLHNPENLLILTLHLLHRMSNPCSLANLSQDILCLVDLAVLDEPAG